MQPTSKRGFSSLWSNHRPSPAVRLNVRDLVTALQVVGDGLSVVLAYATASFLWPHLTELQFLRTIQEQIPPRNYLVNGLVTLCVLYPVFRGVGLYEEHHSILNIREYRDILRGWGLTMLLSLLAVTTIEQSFQSRGIFLLVWILLLSILFLFRFSVYRLGLHLRAAGWRDRRVLIYGAGESGRILASQVARSPKTGIEIAGFLDDDPALHGRTLEGCEVLGGGGEMGLFLRQTGATEILVALPRAPRGTISRIIESCELHGVGYRLVPSLFDIALTQVDFSELGGIPLLGVRAPRLSPTAALTKRVLDLALASCAALVLAPVALFVALLLRVFDGKPLLFFQVRVGEGGRQFQMIKFRTMRLDADSYAPTPSSSQDPRITPIGRWLRRTSLDEIPQ